MEKGGNISADLKMTVWVEWEYIASPMYVSTEHITMFAYKLKNFEWQALKDVNIIFIYRYAGRPLRGLFQ